MKNIRIIQSLRQKKLFKPGLLALTTALIIYGSTIVYTDMVFEKSLSIGGTSAPTGQGPTPITQGSFDPATVVIVAVLAVVTSLSVYKFLHEARQTRKKTEPSPTETAPMPPKEDEWEESPKHNQD